MATGQPIRLRAAMKPFSTVPQAAADGRPADRRAGRRDHAADRRVRRARGRGRRRGGRGPRPRRRGAREVRRRLARRDPREPGPATWRGSRDRVPRGDARVGQVDRRAPSSPGGSACRSSTWTPRSSATTGRTVAGDLRRGRRGGVPRAGGARAPRGLRAGPLGRSRAAAAWCSSPRTGSCCATRGSPCSSTCGIDRIRERVTPGRGPAADPRGGRPRAPARRARAPLPRVRGPRRRRGRTAGRGRRRHRGGAPLERVTVPIPGRSYDVVDRRGAHRDRRRGPARARAARNARSWSPTAVAAAGSAPLEEALGRRGIKAVVLAVPSGEDAKTLQVYGTLLHQLASQEAHRGDLIVALGGGTVGRSRGVRRRHVHARDRVRPGPDHAHGAGGRRDRGEDGREPARGQEPGRRLPPAASRSWPTSRRSRTCSDATTGRARGGREVRPDARPRSSRSSSSARPGRCSPASRRRSKRLVARCVAREGADGGGGRARPGRAAGAQLRSHPGARPRAARRVRRPDPRRGGRRRDGVRRPARRGARPRRRPGLPPRTTPAARVPRARAGWRAAARGVPSCRRSGWTRSTRAGSGSSCSRTWGGPSSSRTCPRRSSARSCVEMGAPA